VIDVKEAMRTREFRAYIHALEAETEAGWIPAAALLGEPLDRWRDLLTANPTWMRIGTFEALLVRAVGLIARAPERASEIASFIASEAPRSPVPSEVRHLPEIVEGEAYLVNGSVAFALGHYARAVIFAAHAEDIFDRNAAWVSARADARLLRARSLVETGRHVAALPLLRHSAVIYRDCCDIVQYVDTLTTMAVALSMAASWDDARRLLDRAAILALREDSVSQSVEAAERRCLALRLRDEKATSEM
jgi:tetratricopeptide (TPR) repeat protein